MKFRDYYETLGVAGGDGDDGGVHGQVRAHPQPPHQRVVVAAVAATRRQQRRPRGGLGLLRHPRLARAR